jgi:hypothetical protein
MNNIQVHKDNNIKPLYHVSYLENCQQLKEIMLNTHTIPICTFNHQKKFGGNTGKHYEEFTFLGF